MVRNTRGSVVPLLAVVVLVAGGAAMLIGRLGGAAIDRARASTAADAAALAGAAEGPTSARALAAENEGDLVTYRAVGLRVSVVVRVGRAVARATAERWPASSLAHSGDGPLASVHPDPGRDEGAHPR
jgi:hypothetical protein